MSSNDNSPEYRVSEPAPRPSGVHKGWYAAIAIALAANLALLINAHQTSNHLAQLSASTQAQMAKLNDLVAQSTSESAARLESVAKQAQADAETAESKARDEVRKNSAAFAAQLAAQRKAQQQVSGALSELKEASSNTNSKLTDLSGDVTGVKGEVSTVKDDVATTKAAVEQHGDQLKRMTGDMGVVSDRIATNSKELAELRQLGERNYVEFDLKRNSKGGMQKVGMLQLALTKADPKRNRFTMNVLADDKKVEKRDRTINEPVQLYVSGAHQPCEIVVNEVKKDEIVGYVAIPKVGMGRP